MGTGAFADAGVAGACSITEAAGIAALAFSGAVARSESRMKAAADKDCKLEGQAGTAATGRKSAGCLVRNWVGIVEMGSTCRHLCLD